MFINIYGYIVLSIVDLVFLCIGYHFGVQAYKTEQEEERKTITHKIKEFKINKELFEDEEAFVPGKAK